MVTNGPVNAEPLTLDISMPPFDAIQTGEALCAPRLQAVHLSFFLIQRFRDAVRDSFLREDEVRQGIRLPNRNGFGFEIRIEFFDSVFFQ